MNTLQKTKLRGTGINCGLIVLLFAVVLLLGQVLPENTYRRVLVPIIWQMCIFILLGTSLNLTLGYLGQLTLGHMGFAGIGAYTAALSSLALERAGVFEASKAAPGQLILVVLGCCLLGAIFAGLLGLLVGIPALRLRGDYLAIVTLGFGLIVENVIANLPFAGGDAERPAPRSMPTVSGCRPRCRRSMCGSCWVSPFCASRSCAHSSAPNTAAPLRPSATMRSQRRPPA